ncbi:hypothetical protein HGM15179_017942, partial [Zosterops borbonicus]
GSPGSPPAPGAPREPAGPWAAPRGSAGRGLAAGGWIWGIGGGQGGVGTPCRSAEPGAGSARPTLSVPDPSMGLSLCPRRAEP